MKKELQPIPDKEEIMQRAQRALLEFMAKPQAEVILSWPPSINNPQISISHGTGSFALLGSEVLPETRGILADRQLKPNSLERPSVSGEATTTLACVSPDIPWLSFSQNRELPMIYVMNVGNHGTDLLLNSDFVRPYVEEIFERPHVIRWNIDRNYYFMGKQVRDEIKDLKRRLRRNPGSPSLRIRLEFFENLRQRTESLSIEEKEKLIDELKRQFPVLLTLEGQGLPLSQNPNIKIAKLKNEELWVHEPVEIERILTIEVPFIHIDTIRSILCTLGITHIEIRPLEIGEFKRIEKMIS